jgi:hypothetical protein
MNFQGKLSQDGRVILDRISGAVTIPTKPDHVSLWTGHFLMPPRNYLKSGQYDLHLDDGRSAPVRIASVAASHFTDARVSFTAGLRP